MFIAGVGVAVVCGLLWLWASGHSDAYAWLAAAVVGASVVEMTRWGFRAPYPYFQIVFRADDGVTYPVSWKCGLRALVRWGWSATVLILPALYKSIVPLMIAAVVIAVMASFLRAAGVTFIPATMPRTEALDITIAGIWVSYSAVIAATGAVERLFGARPGNGLGGTNLGGGRLVIIPDRDDNLNHPDAAEEARSRRKEERRREEGHAGGGAGSPDRVQMAADLDRAYRLFGLKPGVGGDAVRKTYRGLAKKHHPDVHPGRTRWAEERMKELSAARELLEQAETG